MGQRDRSPVPSESYANFIKAYKLMVTGGIIKEWTNIPIFNYSLHEDLNLVDNMYQVFS
jgi:hypothetical protein